MAFHMLFIQPENILLHDIFLNFYEMIDISTCNVVYLKCRSLLSAWSFKKTPWSKADATTFDTEQEVILMKIERINENQIRCTL